MKSLGGGGNDGGLSETDLSETHPTSDHVVKSADEASFFKSDCTELKSKAEKLAALLRQAARASNDLYERPTRRIIDDTEQVLDKAHGLVQKCRAHGLVKRVFTIIPAAAFRKMSAQLENSIGDVSWLLRVSASDGGDEYLGLPPIAANEPILCLIWEQIAIFTQLMELVWEADYRRRRSCAATEASKEGKVEGQENAARAIGLLGRDRESVEQMIHAGVCQVFSKILKDGPMKVQAVVAWAVSELAAHHSPCQDLFAQHNIIRLLVSHLAFETIQEHSKYSVTSKSLHAIVVATNKSPNGYSNGYSDGYSNGYSNGYHNLSKPSLNGNTEVDNPMSHVLLEKGPDDVKYNSAMALMEITAVAEKDPDLRRSAFKPNSPACKSVVDQDFSGDETRMISPLVRLLDEREAEVSREACIALTKFAGNENYLHLDHCKAIIDAGGAKHLIQLAYFGEQIVQSPSVTLLCYIAMNVPDSEQLAEAKVLTVLEWASKQPLLAQDGAIEALLQEAKSSFPPIFQIYFPSNQNLNFNQLQQGSLSLRNVCGGGKVSIIRAQVTTEAPAKVEKVSKKMEEGEVPYREGQSIGVIPDGIDKNGKPHKLRLYSIASSALGDFGDSKTVSLCVKRLVYTNDKGELVKGVCSNFLCDLKPGFEVKITGPVGKEMLMPKDPMLRCNGMLTKGICHLFFCMLATGTGIAPFRGFLWKMFFEKHDDYKFNGLAWLFLGVPTSSSLLYKEEFEKMKEKAPENFRLDFAVSREQTNEKGEKMYIQTRMAQYAEELWELLKKDNTFIYMCGLKGMEKGIDDIMVSLAAKDGIDWMDYKKQLKKSEQWNVEVY
ncbi:hypothetical protein C3L33_17789, partial [Rhododendron williamsianum]